MERTFWQLLKDSKVEIPEIQRDYAQGRSTPKAKAIRVKFVADLLQATQSEDRSLNLDFIFGQSVDQENIANFEQSKDSLKQMIEVLERFSESNSIDFNYQLGEYPTERNEHRMLIPIDGQQRLTTLFLFHLYIGAQIEDADIDKLSAFRYTTRKSSTSFLEKLIRYATLLRQDDKSRNIRISGLIRDQPWFFRFWNKDPTVSGALEVLDEIHRQSGVLYKGDFNKIWTNLTTLEDAPVKFDFFDLKERGLEDDLYIKMNARGKSLSDFENFKAWIEKQFSDSLEINVDHWQAKMDKEWLDIFWSERKSVELVDEQYLAFFNNIALFKKLESAKTQDQKIDEKAKELIKRLSSSEFIPTRYYEQNEVHTSKSINEAFYVLEILKNEKDRYDLNKLIGEIWVDTFYENPDQPGKKFTTALFQRLNSLSLYHRVFVYAALTFLVKKQKSFSTYTAEDKKALKEWLRVARNIIYNSRIDEDFRYVGALQSIDKFSRDTDLNIAYFLSNTPYSSNWISFFNQKQQSEEVEKIRLQKSWKDKLIEAENHHYFYGQIGFILELSKVSGKEDLSKFSVYLEKLQNLFSTNHLDNNQFLIQRALLILGGSEARWMRPFSSNRYSFYLSLRSNSRERDENWRYLFVNDEEGYRLKTLNKLLDKIDGKTESLHNLIEEGKKDIHDWRIYFIREPEIFNYCGQKLINRDGEFHIRLLGSSRLSHYHCELRIKALHGWLKKEKHIGTKLEEVRRSGDASYLTYGDGHTTFEVRYSPENKKFIYGEDRSGKFKEIEPQFALFDQIEEFSKLEQP